MAHDPAVVDIKKGSRRPGAGLVLANLLHYDNTQRARLALSRVVRLRNDFRFRAPLKPVAPFCNVRSRNPNQPAESANKFNNTVRDNNY